MDKEIDKHELGLKGQVYGQGPVQAEGTIQGNLFYFRARFDDWSFSISENIEIDPMDIQTDEAGVKYDSIKKAHLKKRILTQLVI